MPQFLILKLDGVLQAWGAHSYEDYRPSHNFPTRSGLVGLLGACLGVERADSSGIEALNQSFRYAVRVETHRDVLGRKTPSALRGLKITDFHTVLDARTVQGAPRKMPVVSRREYWCDVTFTVALLATVAGTVPLQAVAAATRNPRFTPALGRRNCALSRPLCDPEPGCWREAENLRAALASPSATRGVVYSEEEDSEALNIVRVRDVPIPGRSRRFATREWYLHSDKGEA